MQHCKITEQHSLASWVAFFLIALAGHAAHAQEKPSFSLEGFATVKAYWLNTTTGGGNAPVTVVKTPQEFLAAAERSDIADKKSRNNTPRIIRIANDLDLGVLANERGGTDLKSVGIVHVRSHTTIFAAGYWRDHSTWHDRDARRGKRHHSQPEIPRPVGIRSQRKIRPLRLGLQPPDQIPVGLPLRGALAHRWGSPLCPCAGSRPGLGCELRA